MTVKSDSIQAWPDAVVDIGPIELPDHYWVVVGLIPYDGHVVLAVIGSAHTQGSPPVTQAATHGSRWPSAAR